MTRDDAELVAHLCGARAGLKVDPDKAYLMESRLSPVARREGFGAIEDLIRTVRELREERLIWAVVEAMAYSETSFFRDRAPFDLFRDEVLPTLARLRHDQPLRVWSAACGSGQEIYSLAMIAEGERAVMPGVKVEFFASDLSERALEKAQTGLYTQFEIQRGLPIRKLVDHFEPSDDMWQLSPRIRQMIRWRRVNLVADLSSLGLYDVIFCRHVLSGLVDRMRVRVLESLSAALNADGFLVLGPDDSPAGLTDALRPAPGRPGLYGRNPEFRVAA